MPVSFIVKKECPTCKLPAIETDRVEFGSIKIISLKCGHSIFEEPLQVSPYENVVSFTDWKLRNYQIQGAKFIEESNARCLIADEQGLGKTAQAIVPFIFHKNLLPAVFVTKTTVKHQIFHECRNWVGQELLVQVISSSKEIALPGFQIYILTYDMLKSEESIFKNISPKTLILDECQAIKNHLSERAKAAQRFSQKVEHVIALSGTPIKNNAGEYFTILNILQPHRFPEYRPFLERYCDHYDTMYATKIGGLKDSDLFHEETKDFILRRTRAEAAPELPAMDRQFYHVELDRKFNSAYREAMKELDDLFYSDESDTMSMIAIMTKMRRITGLNKVPYCAEFIREFLESTDRKITIFAHHKGVVRLLEGTLTNELKIKTLNLHAGLTGNQRAELVEKFKNDSASRVMIASTLAAGEGLNLQFCSDCILLERQWNPANEEQAEGRFIRLGQLASTVTATYMLASETIDEYFTELVEKKRAIVKSTLDNESIDWDSNSLMKDLAAVLLSKGKEKWRL